MEGIKLFGKTIVLQAKEEAAETTESPTHVNKSSTTEQEKRPDKIIPCPRCKSMETKFCYFNNYNVNQPRHFCRGCQRYWTAGGALRNVPVGAGRRKAKLPGVFSENCVFDQEAAGGYRQLEGYPPGGPNTPPSGGYGQLEGSMGLEEYWALQHHQQLVAAARAGGGAGACGGFNPDYPAKRRRATLSYGQTNC